METSLEDRAQDSLGSDALQALKGVARVAGGPIGRGAAELGDGAISEAQRDMQVDRSFVLEVPAGTQFEVVITAL